MKLFGAAGAAGLFLSVAFGAFAAHALKGQLSSEMLGVFDVGVRYQVYHSLALLAVAVLVHKNKFFKYAGIFYIAGIILFCFSLYVLSLTDMRWVAFLTPVGGLSLLAGHLTLLIGFLRM